MGYFLAVSAFKSDAPADVCRVITEYMNRYELGCSPITAETDPDEKTDALIFNPRNGWTVVMWPSYFNIHDFAFVRSVAPGHKLLISTVHVYDDDYWEHLCHSGETELHAFCSEPKYWGDEGPEYQLVSGYNSEPNRLASALGVSPEVIKPYLVIGSEAGEAQAHPDDEFALWDFWVFTDFWRRLGIHYPDSTSSVFTTLRIDKDFMKKLPTR